MKVKSNRSKSYIATISLSNKKDLEWLNSLREKIKQQNRFNREHGLNVLWENNKRKKTSSFRIELKGRLGKNNPKSKNYKKYDNGNGYRVKLEDSKFADVYVEQVTN
jgi:hypothetical protein